MKFSSEDLMKAMGLQVGDRVKVPDESILELYRDTAQKLRWKVIENKPSAIPFDIISFEYIYDLEYEILPKPKRVGNLKCDDFECTDCPLKYICCLCDWSFKTNNNLFNILELFNCDDQEIHDLLKARLDKEVEE